MEVVVGRGASSTVWSGRDAMGRAVAIKVPHETGWLADEEATRTEQHVLLAVRHEHLVTLRDVVAMADGRVALVFDLVTGAPLRGTVSARGHLRPGEAVTVVTPLCEAVAVLHGAGGLHGDVSPSNVMLTAQGKPLLLDLGAARLAGSALDAPVHGTAGFVAPEVRQGMPPSEASDVFSLGALAWFCLTGNGAPDTMLRLDPEVIRSHVGDELAMVIGACIDPDPARRPPSSALARLFYETVPAESVEVVVGADEASALTHRIRAEAREEVEQTPESGAPWRAVRWPWSRRPKRTTALLTGLVTLVAVVLGVGAVTARSTASAHEPARALSVPTPTAMSNRPPSLTPSAPATTKPVAADVLLRSDAPRTTAREVIQALSDRRAAAFVARDPTRLAQIDQQASPAWAADADTIERLRSDGVRWEGLALEVAHATPVSVTGTHAVIRARVDWTAYVVVGSGHRVEQPAETGTELDFTVERGPQGWRLVAVSAPAS